MKNFDDDDATKSPPRADSRGDEAELARRAGAGDREAFDLLYDRYFARTSWYFTIFPQREARAAVKEVMTELFASLSTPSALPLAERAYRLSLATELRHAVAPKAAASKRAPAKVAIAKDAAAPPRLRS